MTQNELLNKSIEKFHQGRSLVSIKAFLDYQQVDPQIQKEIFIKLEAIGKRNNIAVKKTPWKKIISKGLYYLIIGIVLCVISTVLFMAMNKVGLAGILTLSSFYYSPINIILWGIGLLLMFMGIIAILVGIFLKAKELSKSKAIEL